MEQRMNSPLDLTRPDLRGLLPYQRADSNRTWTRLHANESPWRSPVDSSTAGLNAYPEARPQLLRQRLASSYGVEEERVLITRGSDEGIDLLVRAFCQAGKSAIVHCPPTFGMYAVSANIQGARVDEVPLVERPEGRGFEVDVPGILEGWTTLHRLLFLCSPNNPTGDVIPGAEVARLCTELAGRGVVIVDEAYAEFAQTKSATLLLAEHENLVVLRTLSKAYALAGARCGVTLADADLIDFLDRLLPPYPLTTGTVEVVTAALAEEHQELQAERMQRVRELRELLRSALKDIPGVQQVWPSHGNFVLCRVADPAEFIRRCAEGEIRVRDMGAQRALRNCLRISVGTEEQITRLEALFNSGLRRNHA